MTEKQIEAANKSLPRIMDVPYKDWTTAQKRLCEELSCRRMINSCLVYGGIDEFWKESVWRDPKDPSYAARYVKALGLKRVKELVAEQEADFAKATVYRGYYTDSEGVTYNSILWGDEGGVA